MARSILKDALTQSGLYGFGVVARRLLPILIVPVYTRYLSTTEYGVADLLEFTLSLAGLLFGMRFGESLLYFHANAKTDDDRRRTVSVSMIGAFLVGALALAIGAALAGPISKAVFGSPEYQGLIRLTLINLVFLFPTEVGLSYLRALNRAGLYAVLSTIRPLVAFAIVLTLMVGYGMKVEAFIWANLITFGALAVYLLIFCFSSAGFAFDMATFWTQLRYGAPLMVHGLGMLMIHQGDRLFLRRVVTLGDIGVYALAYKVGMLVSYIHSAFDQYWRAQVFHILRQADGDRVYVRATTYLLLTLALCAVGITAFVDPVLGLLVDPKFHGARPYIPLLLLAYVFRAAADQFRVAYRTQARTGAEARLTLVTTAFCIACYAIFIPWLAVWGAALATVSTFAFMMVLSYRGAQRIKRYPYEMARLAKIAAATLAVGVPAALYRWPTLPQQALSGIVMVAGFLGLLWLLRFPDRDERVYLRQLVRRFLPGLHLPAVRN